MLATIYATIVIAGRFRLSGLGKLSDFSSSAVSHNAYCANRPRYSGGSVESAKRRLKDALVFSVSPHHMS